MAAPWESTRNHWLIEGPIRFNVESLTVKTPPNKPLSENKCKLELTLERPRDPEVAFSIYLGKKLVSRYPRFPVTAELELIGNDIERKVLNIALNMGEKESIPFPAIPKNTSSYLMLSLHHETIAGIVVTARWIEPPKTKGIHFVNTYDTAINDAKSYDPLALPWATFESLITTPSEPEIASFEQQLDLYAALLKAPPNRSLHVSQPNIDVWTMVKSAGQSVLDRFNLVKLFLGEVADSIRIYASLRLRSSAGKYEYLLVELMDDEDTVLHAVKSKALTVENSAFLDLPLDGAVMKLTVMQEDPDPQQSPRHSKSMSPYNNKRLGTPTSPSRVWARHNLAAVNLRLSELRRSDIRFDLATVAIELELDIKRLPSWISRVLPIPSEHTDPILTHVENWMRACCESSKNAIPLGIAYSLTGQPKTIFHYSRVTIKTKLNSSEEVFSAIIRIPTLRHPELLSVQAPWLAASDISKYDACGDHQKTVLFHSYLREHAPSTCLILALCEMKTTETEPVVISNGRLWSINREKIWDIQDKDCPVDAVLSIVTDSNIFVFRTPTKVQSVVDLSLLANSPNCFQLFGHTDDEIKRRMLDEIRNLPVEVIKIPI